jgi:hypothetical protein
MNALSKAQGLINEAQNLFARADSQGREVTGAESRVITKNLDEVERLKGAIEVERFGNSIGAADISQPQGPGGFGGWAGLARGIDLRAGKTKSVARLESVLRRKDLTGAAVPAGYRPVEGVTVQMGYDNRFVYPLFQRAPLTAENLSITDWRQTGARTVTGSIERDPFSTGEKATLDLTVEHTSEDVRQVAVVIEDVPNAVVNGSQTLMQFLRSEGQLQLDLAIDAHVLAQIDAAVPPTGQDGANLIEQTRNAISAMRLVGSNPTTLILSPDDAADLDLFQTGSDDAFVFPTRDTGTSSPLFGLRIVESASVVDPMLIDPVRSGVLYSGEVALTSDPYSGFSRNTTTLRIEGNVLFHIRDINGVYIVAPGS